MPAMNGPQKSCGEPLKTDVEIQQKVCDIIVGKRKIFASIGSVGQELRIEVLDGLGG